jgi:outer membrane lipoprotein-sorting protein
VKRAALLLALLLAGCPRGPIQFGAQGEITDARQMLAILAKQDARFVTLQGDAKFKVESPQANGTVSQYLAVTRPAALHIETFNFFGKPVSVLVSDGERFSLYDADKNIFYEGPATVEAMSRFLPIALAPVEVVALMLGQVPRIPASDGKLVLDPDKRRYQLTLQAQGATQVLDIDPTTLDVLGSTVRGVSAYDLALGDYQNEPGGRFPHQITLTASSGNVVLTYRYTDVKVNGEPDLSLFHEDPPKGARQVRLDEKGNPVAP